MEASTMYRSLSPRDLFAEVDRLQREMQQAFDTVSPSIRGYARAYPALNVASTPESVEIYAFAPGIDPSTFDVKVERGVLTIEGERPPTRLPAEGKSVMHINERFDGPFRRVVSLPDDVNPGAVKAAYRDGVLHVSVQRSESARPRRVEVR
jgi:HSP20 family protein